MFQLSSISTPEIGDASLVCIPSPRDIVDSSRLRLEDNSKRHLIRIAHFALPNFVNNLGSMVCYKKGKGISAGRVTFEFCGWKVTLDRRPDSGEVYELINKNEGFYETHYGFLSRVDGSTFSCDDLEKCLEILYWFFTFVCESRRGISFLAVYGADGRYLSSMQGFGNKWGKPTSSFSWFPKDSIDALAKLAPGFAKKFSDPYWAEILTYAIHWLSEANEHAGGVEGSIILTQAGLEMLYHAVMVDTRLTNNSGKTFTPMEKMLKHIGIDIKIPASQSELQTLSSQLNAQSGPRTIVKIRNKLLHPSKKDRAQLKSITPEAKFQASHLGKYYLELGLLWLCGYDGFYSDRTDLLGKYKTTPWPSGGNRPT